MSDEIKLENGNYIIYNQNYNLKYSYNTLMEAIPNFEDISILNVNDRRKEKTDYSFNSKNIDDVYIFEEIDYMIVFNKSNNGINFLSLEDGTLLLPEDLLNIIDFKFIKSNVLLLSGNGDVLFFGRQKINIILLKNIDKINFNNSNLLHKYIYNFESDVYIELKKDEKEIMALNNNSTIKLLTKKEIKDDDTIIKFIEFTLSDINNNIIDRDIQFISPIHYKLGYGIYIKKDGIYKYDTNNVKAKVLENGIERKKLQYRFEFDSNYLDINNEYKLLLIDEGSYINIVDYTVYNVDIYGNNIYLKDINGLISIIRNGVSINGLESIFSNKDKKIYKKSGDVFIYDTNEGLLEKLIIPDEEKFEIISKFDKGSGSGFLILFYCEKTNSLYSYEYGNFGDRSFFGGKLSKIDSINTIILKDYIINNFKGIKHIEKYADNFFYIDGRGLDGFTYTKGNYILIDGDSISDLGDEGSYIDKIKERFHYNKNDTKFFILKGSFYSKIGEIIKNVFIFPKSYSIDDIYFSDSEIIVTYAEYQGEYNKTRLERTLIVKNNGEIKVYNGGLKILKPSINIEGKSLFLSGHYAISLDDKKIIVRVGDKEEVITNLDDIIIDDTYIKGINILLNKNGEYILSPKIENIDNIKEVQDFSKEDEILKVIQTNKKEYLTDLFLNKITIKDYNKILEYRGDKTILVKQSGYTYLSNFGGGIISHKFSHLTSIGKSLYLGSDDGINYFIYDKLLQKLSITDTNNNEIVLNGNFSQNEKYVDIFILGLKNGKKIILDVENTKLLEKQEFDDIQIFSNEIFKGTQGRDIYHFNVLTEKPYYTERYYDVIGVQGDFLIVEDRRDYIVLNKDGKNITGKSYKNVYINNNGFFNILKVEDFNGQETFIDISGREYISFTYDNSYKNLHGLLLNGDIINIETGELIFKNNLNVKFIEILFMFNGFKLIDENKVCYFIDKIGNLIYSNKKDIKICNGVKFYDIVAFKEGKSKYSIGNSKGEVTEKEVLSDITDIGADYIRGDISGVNLRYDLKSCKLIVGY